jgi:hypothetical protein
MYIELDNIYIGIKPLLHTGSEKKYYDSSRFVLARSLFNFPDQKNLHKTIAQNQKKPKMPRTLDPENIIEPPPNPILTPLDYKKKTDIEMSKPKTSIAVLCSVRHLINYATK